VEEDNYFGKSSSIEPNPHRVSHQFVETEHGAYEGVTLQAAGYQGVWAKENTREAIWDAMARKETYATTGNRLQVRLFAGWDFEADEVQRPDFARTGYARGVPMGGDLSAAPKGKSPTFMIRALRDADGPNLDRIQVVKGWLDSKDNTQERVYDVAVSDGRKIDANGRCDTPVGSTVNVADATYTNNIGEPLLAAHWVDPDFDPDLKAFYYVRVIEIPTPRWPAYDAKFFGVEMPEGTVMQLQDRAYTSPVWYTP
jgi:hypothetical protein